MRRYIPVFVALAAVVFSNVSSAVTVTVTDPVGFTTTSLPGGSDTFVSIPFTRIPEFIGAIQSIAANNTTTHRQTMTVSGTPGWTTNQFAGTQKYYALIGTSTANDTKEGHTYAVTANGSNTVTVDTTQDNLDGIPVSPSVTQLILIPNWTPATIFPAADANISFTPTSSPPTYKTLIRVPDDSYAGINLPYAAEYYFFNNAWRRVSNPLDNVTDHGNDPLLPDSYFVVRNNNGAPSLPLTSLGSVLLKKLSVLMMTAVSPGRDNPVSLLRPLDVALNATGLSSAFGSNDQLLLFNNAQIGMNKSPSAIYSYDTRWRLNGDATLADHGSDVIPTGTGFVIRKVGGVSVFWTNAFPVPALKAVSRKFHTGIPTPFDIPLPLTGTPGVECRLGSGTNNNDYQIVFTFPTNVTFSNPNTANGAAVTSGTGSVTGTSGSGTTAVTVNLTGVTNGHRITVTLFGVNDGTNTNDVAVRAGFLVGDTTADGSVNSADIGQTKSQSGHVVTISNFREDVTVDGSINSADIGLVKSKSGTALP